MFETPVDAWYVWIGLTIVASTGVGIAITLPTAAPQDASKTARVIDGVAASEFEAVGTRSLANVESVRIGTNSMSTRGPGGTAHAEFGYGPVTPVPAGSDLEAVVRGQPPRRAFDSPSAFDAATTRARATEPTWQDADRLIVRRVSWEGIDVVLVG
jgi:hypothetical protein